MPTIVLTGGGSGGHIVPLLSLAHALKKKSPQCHIVYVGLKGERVEGLERRYEVFDKVQLVTAGKFRRYHGHNFLASLADIKSLFLNSRDFLRVIRGIAAARKLLKAIKPDVVFSKGSFVAVPVGIAAHRLGITIITHDSDAVPGLANRIIGRWAAIHAVGQAVENYNYPKKSIQYTGIPVDERIKPVGAAQQKEYKAELGLPVDSLVLLITGGGLGSGRLNDLATAMSPVLLKDISRLHIVLISGDQHKEAIDRTAIDAEGRIEVVGFTPDFYKYSGAADLILCRAGASTLAELAIQGKACVVVPASQLSGGHQLANVRQLKNLDAAEVLDDNIESKKLLKILSDLLQNPQRREELGAKLGTLARPNAADELADIILGAVPTGPDS